MGHMHIFGKKLPAWLLLTALVVVGAGAATGLVLKDQVNGTTTVAVSQAIRVGMPTASGDMDEFLGTQDDDGMAWGAHFEANNGDSVTLILPVENHAGASGDVTVSLLTLSIPEGMTINIEDSLGWPTTNPVRINYNQWKFGVPAGWGANSNGVNTLSIEIAIEDAQPTGFYELQGVITPLNV